MAQLFHIIEDAQVVLRSKGVFYQKKVYRRGDRLFAAWGTGYIRLGGSDATSCPNVSYESLDVPAYLQISKGDLGEPLLPQLSQIREVAGIRSAA